jgi:hypothetical protein
MLVDFLIVYDRADRSAAGDLRAALENDGASCLLRASDGVGQATPTTPLNQVMRESSVVALVVSERAGPAFWQQNDIATIRKLLADVNRANRIVLVLVSGTARSVLPPDLASATAYDAGASDWAAVVRALAAEAPSAGRPATVSAGRSMAIIDAIWDDLERARTGQPPPAPDSYGQRFETEGDDLVVRSHGQVLERITPDEYEQRLTPGQLEDVARIEKSMEINLAEWKRVYPTRAVNAADGALFVRVRDALVEDLDAVSHLLQVSGFWLDDHYIGVRGVLRSST